jgi:cyclophilin family peptidyl-prolyl cis-trans isomerase
MMLKPILAAATFVLLGACNTVANAPVRTAPPAAKPEMTPRPSLAEVLAESAPSDWRALNLIDTMVMELPGGRKVTIEMSPSLAPNHVANVRRMVTAGYFDGLSINRSQDNYVVQWGDANAEDAARRKALPAGVSATLKAEFTVPFDPRFEALGDVDGYAPETGWVDGFPVGADRAAGLQWGAHCYATVGVGRDLDSDSGGGTELYVVIGQPPRWLDRNITVIGRVVDGMEHLSVLPRGTGSLGFYETAAERTPILRVRMANAMPTVEQPKLERLKTYTPTWKRLLDARRNRLDDFYKRPAGFIDICGVPLPVRPATTN